MTIFRTLAAREEWTPPSLAQLPPEQRPVLVLRPLTARQRLEILKLNQAAQEKGSDGPILEACYLAARAGIVEVRNLRRAADQDPVQLEFAQAEVLGSSARVLTEASLDLFEVPFLVEIGQHVFRRALLEDSDRGKPSSPPA